jgi:putative endonuclease
VKCGDGSLYTGVTTEVLRRIDMHNAGKGAKYTRSHLPVQLVYSEAHVDQPTALKRELSIKKMTRGEKLKLIEASLV